MTPLEEFEPCPGCRARFAPSTGATHPYIGASPACWLLYSSLLNGGEPPLAPAPVNMLLVDAYAVQHPGTPSRRSIQSVAVHLLTLYGVLEAAVMPSHASWIRSRAIRLEDGRKIGPFDWLEPPERRESLTLAEVVRAPGADERTSLLGRYIQEVWQTWKAVYLEIVAGWYERYVLSDGR